KPIFLALPLLILSAACGNEIPATPPAGKALLESFEFSVRNSGMMKEEIFQTVLTETKIRVINGEDQETLQFSSPIQYSDSLNRISEISISTLDSIYTTDCIADGLQLTVVLKKADSTKIIHISNFYHPDIALLLGYMNSHVPQKFRILYDKNQLEEGYRKCQESKKKPRT
ncbi:MAG TPA: hypothetical protein VLC28_14680, partial [Flavitalea sp.]|nr:hypothetical protein [Flavitalea sp.]